MAALGNATPTPPPTDIITVASGGPNMGFLDSVNTFLPYVVAVAVGIAAMIVFVWYRQKYMPEIARQLTKAYHSRGLPAFIQDEMGNIGFYFGRKKLPEGVIYIEKMGWFLLPNPPPFSLEELFGDFPERKEKNPVGRPRKEKTVASTLPPPAFTPEDLAGLSPEEQEKAKLLAEKTKWLNTSRAEKEEWIATHGVLVRTPILKGFGRQVFFGSSTAAALSNLQAIAHADLPKVRALAPRMYQKTQLDALATGSRLEGMKQSGRDTTKWIFAAIAAAIVIGSLGLVVYLLTQHPA